MDRQEDSYGAEPRHRKDTANETPRTHTPPTPQPPPSTEPAASTDPRDAANDSAEDDRFLAKQIERGSGALYLSAITASQLGVAANLNVMARYLESLGSQCGGTGDPLQRMMLEQIVTAHHRIAQLQIASSEARTPEAALANLGAATKLMAEFRKSTLAYRELQKVSMENAVFVKQVAKVATADEGAQPKKPDTELVSKSEAFSKTNPSKPKQESSDAPLSSPTVAKPLPTGSRSHESNETRRNNGGGAPPITNSDAIKQTMAALNRAAQRGW